MQEYVGLKMTTNHNSLSPLHDDHGLWSTNKF